jgi:D-inositol-3-phosphate glycosyltransferase
VTTQRTSHVEPLSQMQRLFAWMAVNDVVAVSSAQVSGSAPLMRIAFVSCHGSPLDPPGAGEAGGMNVYVRELARALAARGAEVDVLVSRGGPARLSPCARVLPVSASLGRRYDVVHSHYWRSGRTARLLAAEIRAPLVHTPHTLARVKNRHLPPGEPPELDARLAAEEEAVVTADLVVVSTEAERRALAATARASVVPPGVDRRRFRPGDRAAARAALGLEDGPIVLYAGRIQPLKGLDLALRALALVEPAPLFLVAGGPSGPHGGRELRRLRQLARTPVRFLGPQPHTRLPLLYGAADALLVCSYSESFCLAALEALACGTPVIGTAVGGLPALVRDGESGFLLPHRSPALLADRLVRALSGSLRPGAERAAAPYSWDRSAQALLRLYSRLEGGSASLAETLWARDCVGGRAGGT